MYNKATLEALEAALEVGKDFELFKLMKKTKWSTRGWRIVRSLPWFKRIIPHMKLYWFLNHRIFFGRIRFILRDFKRMCVNPKGRKQMKKDLNQFFYGGK